MSIFDVVESDEDDSMQGLFVGRISVLSVDVDVCFSDGCVGFAAVGKIGFVAVSFGGGGIGLLSAWMVGVEVCLFDGCDVFVLFVAVGAVVVFFVGSDTVVGVCCSVESVGGAVCCSVGDGELLAKHLSE